MLVVNESVISINANFLYAISWLLCRLPVIWFVGSGVIMRQDIT